MSQVILDIGATTNILYGRVCIDLEEANTPALAEARLDRELATLRVDMLRHILNQLAHKRPSVR